MVSIAQKWREKEIFHNNLSSMAVGDEPRGKERRKRGRRGGGEGEGGGRNTSTNPDVQSHSSLTGVPN